MKCFFPSIVGFLFYATHSFSQTYQFKTISIEEGLPHSEVYAICQDNSGYLWIGTAGGLTRYDGNVFENFTTSDGLSSNIIYSIFEDSNNQLWLGTGKGICQKRIGFINEKTSFHNISSKWAIVPNRITSIIENINHEIWFGTAGPHEAIWIYNPSKENSFQCMTKAKGLLSEKVFSLHADSDSNIWIGHFNGELEIFHLQNLYRASDFNNRNNRGTIWNIFEDSKKNIWVSTDDGVYRFSSVRFETGNKFSATIFQPKALSKSKIRVTMEDERNNLWFATNNGVFFNDIEKDGANSFSKLLHFLPVNGLSATSFWAGIKDREGNLWFGSFGGGLNKFSGFTFINYSKKNGLKDEQVQCINEDHLSRVILGTEKGVYILNNREHPNDSISFQYIKIPNITNNVIYDIEKDSSNKLFFATYGAGLQIVYQSGKDIISKPNITQNLELSSNKILNILISKRNDIWCSTSNGLSRIIFDKSAPPFNRVDSILNYNKFGVFNRQYSTFEDKNKNIWIGSNFGIACMKYDTFSKKYTPVNIRLGQNFHNNVVYALIEDGRRNIWAGVYGHGLLMIPNNKSKIETVNNKLFSSKDGLGNLNINSLLFDNDSNLWIGTVKGIIKFNYPLFIKNNKIEFTSFGLAEGFFGIECKPNAVFKDHDGKIWFGTSKGVTVYDREYDKKNQVEPVISLNSVKLHFQNVDLRKYLAGKENNSQKFEFPIEKNHLTFEFIGVSLCIPEKVLYQFKLDGSDQDWSPITSENKTTYSNLKPGRYQFNVRACNNDGIWNEKAVMFNFRIKPPFWETWWFYSSELLLFLSLLSVSFIIGHSSSSHKKYKTVLIFISIFVVFEFTKTLLEPYFDNIGGGIPIFKVFMNLILAIILLPLEKIFSKYLGEKK